MNPLTFADALRSRGAAATPLVTHYDLGTGSRIELSVASYANWVAKTSSLVSELVDRGDTVLVDLPVHWQEPVWAGAAWNCGLVVVADAEEADLVVCGPDGIDRYDGHGTVVATSLHPLGLRLERALPAGFVDFGSEVFGQPDAFLPLDPPTADDPAIRLQNQVVDHRRLIEAAAASASAGSGARTLTDVPAVARPDLLIGPLLGGGGTVWLSNAGPDDWATTAAAEGTTVEVRSEPGQPARS